MDKVQIYIDHNDDLWMYFEDWPDWHMPGPFLSCFDGRTMKFKKDIRLYGPKGNPRLIGMDPLFLSQDSECNFILGSDMGEVIKVDHKGEKLFTRYVQKKSHVRSHDRYFVVNRKSFKFSKHISGLCMLSMTMDEQGEHIFMSDGSRCDHGEPLALTREGKIDYFFELPFGPSAMCTRDGKLYLVDFYHSFIHITDFRGKWIAYLDVFSQGNFDQYYCIDKEGRLEQHSWRNDTDEDHFISTICFAGEDTLAIAMEDGDIILIKTDGTVLQKIQPPRKNAYPSTMASDSKGNIYVYYFSEMYSRGKPLGLYRFSQNGEMTGRFFKSSTSFFTSKERHLQSRIDNNEGDAYDYFELADIHARKKKITTETIDLLRKALELNPDFPLAMGYLGLSLKELGDAAGGMVYLEKAYSKIRCPELASYVINCCCLLNHKEKGLRYYRLLIEKDRGEDAYLSDEQMAFLGVEREK